MKTNTNERVGSGRRAFLQQVGGVVAVGSWGVGLPSSAFYGRLFLGPDGEPLSFGKLERLMDLMALTAIDDLQPALVTELKSGVSLENLIGAGALANARAFGGQNYNGYHAFMAMIPALEIALASQGKLSAMCVLKVLHRNALFMREIGAHSQPRLKYHAKELKEAYRGSPEEDAKALLQRLHRSDMLGAEGLFDGLVQADSERAFEALIPVIWQEVDVHRVVLAWRAWDMQRLAGPDQARTLLRQSIRQCIDREHDNADNRRVRSELPEVLEGSGLMDKTLGSGDLGSQELMQLATGIANGTRKRAAELAAEALLKGVQPRVVGEALSLSSTQLMLRQIGREQGVEGRPRASVHGAGTGVHASDTAAAWRAMAGFGSQRQCKLALVAGAYHAGGQSEYVASEPFGYSDLAEELKGKSAAALLKSMNGAIGEQDQVGAAAAASAYAAAGYALNELLDVCREHSVRADGALHAEKYFRTQEEVLVGDRAELRPSHAAGLARVCASQSCSDAVGREQALELLS